jgi:hypothetical protein
MLSCVGCQWNTSSWNPLAIGHFLSMEVLCGLSEMIILVCIIGDRVGQLGESGEYWMGRLRVVWIVNLEIQGGSPRLCRLRPASIGSEWTSIWNVLTHMGHKESLNWVASCVDELDNTLPCFTIVQWIVFGPPTVCPSRHTHGRRH